MATRPLGRISRMTKYVALLRAVNLGPHNKFPMSELKSICELAGFANARTYIASGNVIFESKLSETSVKAKLKERVTSYAGKPVDVMVRTGAEMAAVLVDNPFKSHPPNRVVAIFLDGTPPKDTLKTLTGQSEEKVAVGTREIYVHYGKGMGRSKLKIPAAKNGTARNMNTVGKLAELTAG
jgi:uncharacterized protein (DUF1697 family)